MATPLLQTKLHIPPPRPELVPRPRLIERLNAGLRHKLTLISAPAGLGKTTLMSTWVAGLWPKVRVAWFSLDTGDSDIDRFLAYLIAALQAALQTTYSSIGQGVLAVLRATKDSHE